MKVRKNISLEENILELGLKNADKLGLNFSSYITMLINQDTKGIISSSTLELEDKIPAETKEEVKSSIDDILNI